MSNITKLNYKNNEYSLDGYTLEQALELLQIDKDSVTMETEGDTLYIMAKAGSKGLISLADMDPEKPKAISLAEMAKEVQPVRKNVKLVNGELVEVPTRKMVQLINGELVEVDEDFYNEYEEDLIPESPIVHFLALNDEYDYDDEDEDDYDEEEEYKCALCLIEEAIEKLNLALHALCE